MTMFKFMPDPDGDPESCLIEAATFQLMPDADEASSKRKPKSHLAESESRGFVIDQDREMMPRQQVG